MIEPFIRFKPLKAGHPAIGKHCGLCQVAFEVGDETGALPDSSTEPVSHAAVCHWECLLGTSAAAFAWTAPRGAVPPVNHFHTIYMRAATMSDKILKGMDAFDGEQRRMASTLITGLAELSRFSASMTVVLQKLRREYPKVWELWLEATADSAEEERNGQPSTNAHVS